ncbi:unknown [Clostridium sp. CAG:354]|nr:unknown [Clostridium sp. CAG:354]HIT24014.1 hypothetical protein [Candidatus Faecimonas intestinavium]
MSMIDFYDLIQLGTLIDYVKDKKQVADTPTNICRKVKLEYSPYILWKKINENKEMFYEEYYILLVDGNFFGEKSDEYLIHFYKKCGFREINSKAKYMIKE